MNTTVSKGKLDYLSSFWTLVVRHGLEMMIPLVLTGGICCALINLPFAPISAFINNTFLGSILNALYLANFGLFSFALVISLTASYCMERNMTVDKASLYIIVSVCSYGTLIFDKTGAISAEMLEVKGCFFALCTAIISCSLLERLRKISPLKMKKYSFGMPRITALSISILHPALIIIVLFALSSQIILRVTDSTSLYGLVSALACSVFNGISNNFIKGLFYTFLVHGLWAVGLHGSHILEPVAETSLSLEQANGIFSKQFFDTYVVMGGCGTTICVLICILIFFKRNHYKEVARLACFTVAFNLNEILTFGIPIILNPILIIPFIATPIFCYVTAYLATFLGLIPPIVNKTSWSTPIFINSYIGTHSINACILQLIMIAVGTAIYYPFIKKAVNNYEILAQRQVQEIVTLLHQENEPVDLLAQSNIIGQVSRVLRHDLKIAIERRDLYLLYQPQVDNDGKFIGAEALVRWEHPLYGYIYPPLILYLAKEGNLLEPLEKYIIDTSIDAINEIKETFDDKFKISINITAKSLFWNIEPYIRNKIAEKNVEPRYLWIEITEQDALSDAPIVIETIEKLKNDGHTMIIDDFGMGHTSILYLQSSQFGVVKLDGSLVKDIESNTTNQNIIASIINLAKKMDIKIVAEFVENEAQKEVLERLGCDWYQGYLYSQAITLEELIEYTAH